jgi:hypothetical protein
MMSDTPSVACGREKARDFGFSGRTEMRCGRGEDRLLARETGGGWRTGAIISFSRWLVGLWKMTRCELCLAEESLGGSQVGFQLWVYWRRETNWPEG